MPTVISHALIGGACGMMIVDRNPIRYWPIMVAAALVSTLPDVDGLFMRWIPYEHPFGHRGFTHSLFFAVIMASSAIIILRKTRSSLPVSTVWIIIGLMFAACSHGLLDMATDGGLGIALFAPFDTTRYFFPIQPIPVAPLRPTRLLTPSGFHILAVEAGMLWTIALAVILSRSVLQPALLKWILVGGAILTSLAVITGRFM